VDKRMIDPPSFIQGIMVGLGVASFAALVVGIYGYINDKYFPNKRGAKK
jgi:hypothetical protein